MRRLHGFGRLGPATGIAAALLLSLKLVDLGHALMRPGVGNAGAMVTAAQAEPAPAPAPAAPAPGAVPPAAEQAAASGADPGGVAMPTLAPSAPEPGISPAERQLLQDLRTRRAELDVRERALQQREAVLDAAEHRLTGRVGELTGLQTRLEQLEAARREHDEANWGGLVKMYETMKPREAAAIFNDMDLPVLLAVIDRMKDSKAAQILGAMQPDRARMLTAQLAAQRTRSTTVPPERPGPG